MTQQIARVAIDVPLVDLFDYLASSDVQVGALVNVPFGQRQLPGLVVEVQSHTIQTIDKLKSITAVCQDIPLFSKDWLNFCLSIAKYYLCSPGEVMLPALPVGVRNPKKWQTLAKQSAKSQPQLKTSTVTSLLPVMTSAQEQVLQTLNLSLKRGGYASFLLYGVTGSGKTEIYLRFIANILARDQLSQVLLLIPEINLTPQFAAELYKRFSEEKIAVLHSGLADGARAKAWLASHLGKVRIVLGTRLAVLASIPYLAAIIVDEEHDTSYKQQEGIRYSARDLAIWRAYQLAIPVVLGSATPTLETWQHSEPSVQRYRRLILDQRAQSHAMLPVIKIIDLGKERKSGQKRYQGMSQQLLDAIALRLQRSEQSLLYLNRRGYAPILSCEACGWLSECMYCSTGMVLHYESQNRFLCCHHCGLKKNVPNHCPACGNVDLVPLGRGTQRIEETLAQLFPKARIARIDADTTRRKGQAQALLSAVHVGNIDILIGTQMIAKGHDFQRVTLVGVINPDTALYSHDFRASERLFAQLMQVSGRAGRAGLPGEVLVQTFYPQAALFQALLKHDYPGYAAFLLEQRRKIGMPPFAFHALLIVEGRDLSACLAFLKEARKQAIIFPDCVNHNITLFDPVPCALSKKAGKAYAQMLIESTSRQALQSVLGKLTEILRVIRPRQKWLIERDPIAI